MNPFLGLLEVTLAWRLLFLVLAGIAGSYFGMPDAIKVKSFS
jgi:hypothetical protein